MRCMYRKESDVIQCCEVCARVDVVVGRAGCWASVQEIVAVSTHRMQASHLRLPQNLAILLQQHQLPLLLKHLPRPLKHHLKPLLPLRGILLKPLDRKLLNAILDLLPAATQRRDFRPLRKRSCGCRGCGGCGGLVNTCFADVEEVCPGNVHGAESEFLRDGVDVGCFVNHGVVVVADAEDGIDPFGGGLPACDEAF
jgi:hypothetical protein